jgi:hypothetical protein
MFSSLDRGGDGRAVTRGGWDCGWACGRGGVFGAGWAEATRVAVLGRAARVATTGAAVTDGGAFRLRSAGGLVAAT